MMLGPVIAAYREQHRYGVRALAKIIGISAATLNRVENENACDSTTLAKIMIWLFTAPKGQNDDVRKASGKASSHTI
jgi:DNA-binding XRE family transcriptional regulator